MFLSALVQGFLALVALCVSFLYIYLRNNFNYWKDRNVPYQKPSLLFGNLTFLMRKSVWDYFHELRQKFPSNDYVGIYLGWTPALVVQTPELAERILTKDFEHFQSRMVYSSYETDPLGTLNLLALKSPAWSQVKHELTPMFTSLRLKHLTDLMNENSKELVLKIKRDFIDKNECVNLKALFAMCASDTVASAMFGIKVSALNDPSSPVWYIARHMVNLPYFTFRRGFEFLTVFYLPAVAVFMRLKFFSKEATDYLKKLFWDVVEQRKAAGTSETQDLVYHLLKLKENLKLPAKADSQLADNYMLAQAAMFILGPTDTSSTTFSVCLHELAHHPKEQEALYEEINEAMTQKGKDVLDYDDLMELKFLTACIMESFRKYTPVQTLIRVCNKRYKLNDDVTVEEGTPVVVNVIALHHDEETFPEADQWKPERMHNVTESDNMQYSLLPFGEGPRYCLGKRYGVMQIRAALAQVLAKYKVEPDPSEPYTIKTHPYTLFMAPLSGGRVKFTPR